MKVQVFLGTPKLYPVSVMDSTTIYGIVSKSSSLLWDTKINQPTFDYITYDIIPTLLSFFHKVIFFGYKL